MLIEKKIKAIISSTNQMCKNLIDKELTGKTIKITQIGFGMEDVKTYTCKVLEIDLIRIEGSNVVIYLSTNRDGEIIYTKTHLNLITIL